MKSKKHFLLKAQLQAFLSKALENKTQVLHVLLHGATLDTDVVEVDIYEHVCKKSLRMTFIIR
jgi:hypothetical protein